MPLALQKPRRLVPGDRIAVVSPSWGGPGTLPQRYAAGKRQLGETFGLQVVDMPHTLASAEDLAAHPEWRAADLHQAFADPSIAGIFASIGGDDSIRLLPHLDLDIIRRNPKVFLGFSDTTTIHLACLAAGLASFYGPSIMAGFAENGGMHAYTVDSLRKTSSRPIHPASSPSTLQAGPASAPIGLIPSPKPSPASSIRPPRPKSSKAPA
ncbi:LD-carboxypeptidase [Devosia sp. BK]|uniref:LD-carboxypeptidase n=1 Tax=Devosia sp. BK TaxID=2871706 RepID=UPI00293A8A97|nr:LD-carboxypeptidase [Devosia sp. BK]MDV3250045.1 LD-carboxypeptidase [Devosia sp. BK]